MPRRFPTLSTLLGWDKRLMGGFIWGTEDQYRRTLDTCYKDGFQSAMQMVIDLCNQMLTDGEVADHPVATVREWCEVCSLEMAVVE